MRCVVQVPLRGVRVMRRRQVIAGLVMFGGFAMMPRRVFVVFSCLVMVFCRLFGHGPSLDSGFGLRRATVTSLCEWRVTAGLRLPARVEAPAAAPGGRRARS